MKKVCIKNDFEVHEWSASNILERAAKELLEEEWNKEQLLNFLRL